MMRQATIKRETAETKVDLSLNIDGQGKGKIDTGIGFFNHMLTLLAFHSGMDLEVKANGDLDVCDHHTIEDIGIVLGQAMAQALQDKKGIERYGSFNCPMDETLCNVTLDFSGRAYLVYHCELKRDQVGTMACEMVEEFLRAFAFNCGLTLHVNVYYGNNDHHKIEAVFKALGHAIKQAVQITGTSVNSSKGVLE